MKTLMILLALAEQPAHITPFNRSEITVVNFDDNLHSKSFGNLNARMKALAIVITNNYRQPLTAAQVLWTWTNPNGGTTQIMQKLSRFGYSPMVQAGSMALILPYGNAVQPGQRAVEGYVGIPAVALKSVRVTIDTAIFADGLVIGPDRYQFVADLQGKADAIHRLTAIVNTAQSHHRDPQPEITAAATDTSLPAATRRYMKFFANTWPLPPAPVLPKFHKTVYE